MELEMVNTADGGNSQSTMHQNSSWLSKSYAEYTIFQQAQIQKIRLKFLRSCKQLSAPGSCSSYNIIYLVTCKLCLTRKNAYIGRSTRQLRQRMLEHRNAFYEILDGKTFNEPDDMYSLGIHLHEHGCTNREDFANNYLVCIIDNCSPNSLEVKEHTYIHNLKTLRPNGINVQNPFKIPILL